MAVSAFVALECDRDPSLVVAELRTLEGVKMAHALFGDMDAFAFIEAPDLKALDEVVTSLYTVQGVTYTDTRITRPVD
ncbi:MAG: Lrp/AsnC ligand binding domain-containing protein [Anaerolineae bacterium]